MNNRHGSTAIFPVYRILTKYTSTFPRCHIPNSNGFWIFRSISALMHGTKPMKLQNEFVRKRAVERSKNTERIILSELFPKNVTCLQVLIFATYQSSERMNRFTMILSNDFPCRRRAIKILIQKISV